MGRQRLRLILKMALHRPVRALGTVALALVLVMACVSVSGFVSAYVCAVERGAQSNFGVYSRQVTGNEDVVAYMRSLQEKGEAVAISHARQNILKLGTQKATSADVTIVSGSADLGVLVAGCYPNKPGELSVSSAVAKQLQAEPGDHLELIDADNMEMRTSFTLTGITENPASINEVSAIGVNNNEKVFASSKVWLTNDDLLAVRNALGRGGGEVATVASVIKRASDNAVSYQAISPRVAWLFGGLMVVALVAAIYAADRQRRRSVYRVLTALGDKPGRAALTTCMQTTLLALSGGLIGWAVAVILFPSLSAWLATYFEQRWRQVPWNAMTIAAIVTLSVIVVGGLFTAVVTVASHKRKMHVHSDGFSRCVLVGIGATGIVVTLLLIAGRQLLIFPQGHRVAMVVGAVSIPIFAYAIALITRERKVIARLGNRMQRLTLSVLAVVFTLNYYGALYASGVADLTNWLSGQISGENSYLQISNANEQAINNLLKKFPELKPHAAIFGDISTNEQMFRITDSEGAQCFKIAKSVVDCPQANLDMVYVASGGLAARKYVDHAPATYVAKDGTVTLIGIGITDSTIIQVATVDRVIGDNDLENNILRGLILSADSPLLNQLGVSKPQSYTAIITGFTGFPDEVRDEVRATVLAQAPFATLSDSDDPQIRQLHAQAVTRQLFVVIVSGILLLALVASLISDQRIERRLIELAGGGKLVQVRLLKPLLFAYAVTVASGVLLGHLASMDRIPFMHLESAVNHDYGLVWTMGLAGLLFLIPALIMVTRIPRDS